MMRSVHGTVFYIVQTSF